jgi:hypothetical protein
VAYGVPSNAGSINRRLSAQAGTGLNDKPYLKNRQSKREGDMSQVVEHLHDKHEVLSSNPGTVRKINPV